MRSGRHIWDHQGVPTQQSEMLDNWPGRRGSHLQKDMRRDRGSLLGHSRWAASAWFVSEDCVPAAQLGSGRTKPHTNGFPAAQDLQPKWGLHVHVVNKPKHFCIKKIQVVYAFCFLKVIWKRPSVGSRPAAISALFAITNIVSCLLSARCAAWLWWLRRIWLAPITICSRWIRSRKRAIRYLTRTCIRHWRFTSKSTFDVYREKTVLNWTPLIKRIWCTS